MQKVVFFQIYSKTAVDMQKLTLFTDSASNFTLENTLKYANITLEIEKKRKKAKSRAFEVPLYS